jgi:hypothetical protein
MAAAVVVVDAELVELQAITVVASNTTAPAATACVFQDAPVILPQAVASGATL